MKDLRVRTICSICGNPDLIVSESLRVCLECIRNRWDEASNQVEEAHRLARISYGLPIKPPQTDGGISCGLCSNDCTIGEGETGFCGLRWNEGGLQYLTSSEAGLAYAYLDPHITNCCAAWFCPAGTDAGYSKYSYKEGPEFDYANLAVFHYGCNFDCLFCQNKGHKEFLGLIPQDANFLARRIKANSRISCICHFGGSPEPQLPFALEASKRALETQHERILRVCFEWNGCGDPKLVEKAAELAFWSGGNIKFDLKTFSSELSLALSGVSNERAYQNFKMIAEKFFPERKGLPVLTATTLLVPGYIDANEIEAIAGFIADLDSSIPYSLLCFHPDYRMIDLPYTSLKQAKECWEAARRHLKHVNMGNLHILGIRSMLDFTSIPKESR